MLLLAIAAAPTLPAQTPNLAPYLMSDHSAEIALARSAAPRPISDSATILVLTKTGYVESVHGTNGFTCMVQRSFHAPIGDPNFWNANNRGPMCMNAPAMRTVFPEVRKRTEWIMAGVSPSEIAKRTRQAYASHSFPMPAVGSMGYMLSPEQHLTDVDPHWVPHLMFWYDKSVPATEWGLGDANNTIMDGTAADTVSPVRLLLIPVRRWSDGKAAVVK